MTLGSGEFQSSSGTPRYCCRSSGWISVSLLKLKSNPVGLQCRLIAVGNFRIFVFVWNHPAALFDSPEHVVIGFLMRDFESEREDTAAIADSQMACRFLAGIEVLVKPIARRAVDTAFAPFDLNDLVVMAVRVRMQAPLFLPEQHVPDGLQSNDNCARAMVVRLVIFAHRPLAEVADQRIPGHLKLAQTQPRPFYFEVLQKRIRDIGDKVRFPDIDQTTHVTFLSDVKIVFFTMESIGKAVGTIEDKGFVSIDVEGQ